MIRRKREGEMTALRDTRINVAGGRGGRSVRAP